MLAKADGECVTGTWIFQNPAQHHLTLPSVRSIKSAKKATKATDPFFLFNNRFAMARYDACDFVFFSFSYVSPLSSVKTDMFAQGIDRALLSLLTRSNGLAASVVWGVRAYC